MTATNHSLTGALVALVVKQPVLVMPLAFLSHFVLDAIPHFGIHDGDALRQNSSSLFRTVVILDTLFTVTLLLLFSLKLHSNVPSWVVLFGMIAAIAPDSVWIYRFIGEVRKRQTKPLGRLSSFHELIQWQERPWGLVVEFIWAATMALVMVTT